MLTNQFLLNRRHILTFSNAKLFVGNDIFLQRLHTTFVDHPMVVITGRSGVGKTAVLREYARRFAHEYQAIAWLNAATDETFLADLITALQTYALPVDMGQGIAHLFQTLHNYMSTQQQALLILDNFSPVFTVQDLSEQHPTLHIVISTHVQQTPPELPRLELTALDANDGALLLLRRAGLLSSQETLEQAEDEQRQGALELARELRGLPIALHLAGSYLRMTGCSVQDSLSSFRDASTPFYLPTGSDKRDMEAFAVACERNLIHIKETDPAAFELLQMCALFLPEDIPAILLQSQARPTTSESAIEQEPPPGQLLFDAGFLMADQQTPLLTMHRLLQDIVRQSLTTEQQQQCIKQALILLHQHLPALQTEELPIRLRIAGQIRHLATLCASESAFSDPLMNTNEAADVFTWAAALFWEQQQIGSADRLLRRALPIWIQTLGKAHPIVATTLSNLATINGLLKNYAEAETFAHQAITSKTNALGINHPDILLALDQLAHLYAEQGKLTEASQCYEKAITIGETVKLQRHPLYSSVMYNLALLHMEQEAWAEAGKLLRKVCVARTGALGSQDPATMEAWLMLAKVSIQQHDWQWANLAYQRALPICEHVLGAEHPITLDHHKQAASVLQYLEERTETEIMQQPQERTETKIKPPSQQGLESRKHLYGFEGYKGFE
jgi:tetratricopeptide (TPR) repeat protein